LIYSEANTFEDLVKNVDREEFKVARYLINLEILLNENRFYN